MVALYKSDLLFIDSRTNGTREAKYDPNYNVDQSMILSAVWPWSGTQNGTFLKDKSIFFINKLHLMFWSDSD